MYQNTSCGYFDDRRPAEIECTINALLTMPQLQFKWRLSPVWSPLGDLRTVQSRQDVIRDEFRMGGVGQSPTGEKAGVATVTCAEPASADPQCDMDLRVAFIISTSNRNKINIATLYQDYTDSRQEPFSSGSCEKDFNLFPSLFRTVGYDWVKQPGIAPSVPFYHEMFAILSLYKISQMIAASESPDFEEELSDGLRTADGYEIIPANVVRAYVSNSSCKGGIRVGNNSDYQLGASRGACSLIHWSVAHAKASYLGSAETLADEDDQTGSQAGRREWAVVPKAFTPMLPNTDRTFILFGDDGGVTHSMPCVLVTNWIVNQIPYEGLASIFRVSNNFPAGYRTGVVAYTLSPREQQDSQRRAEALGLRASAAVLHMLGFKIVYNSETQISGMWPREGFLD
jgi:hypothetical protein